MTTTLQAYTVHSRDGEWLMTAPMMIISAFFCMRREATARVLAELDGGATTSKVCFNGRGSTQ